jgi:GT2 family glycosyltransferase
MKNIDVTVEIATKNRYHTTLPICLMSVAFQTHKPKKILIFDDGDHKDLREDSTYTSIFNLFFSLGIEWTVVFGDRKGQVDCHQRAIQMADTDWIWRVDDDDAPEPNVLELLIENIDDKVGAISGLILTPGPQQIDNGQASSKIEDIYTKPNLQWFLFEGVREVDHLNNSFLFRKEAAKHGYCMDLSPVGHREETMFTYEMKLAGYKLLVDPRAKIWHLRNPQGGIRSYESSFFWQHDEKVFAEKLKSYKIQAVANKIFVLDCGLGDHFAFKMVLPEIREKYKNSKISIAVAYPEAFADEEDITLLSIQDAKNLMKDIDDHNVYKYMITHNWQGKLVDAYRKMYL